MTRQQRLVLTISVLASAVAAIDGFIVNVALPTISHSLHGGLAVQQWTVDAYLLTLGSLILVAGSLSDLLGRKQVLRYGLVGFGITSLLCAVAPNGAVLVVARALQGVAGALLTPSSLALIISSFSGKAQGKAIGTWTAGLSIAPLLGPILGGLILSVASWRWIFAVNVAPIGITLWLMARLKQAEVVKSNTKVDVGGALLCAVGLGASVFALIEQPNFGWGAPRIWLPFTMGLLLLVVFIAYERRLQAPMLPLSLFRTRNFSVGNVTTLMVYAGLSVSSFLLTITLQQVGGFSPLQASLAMLPVTVLMFFLSSRFGALAGRYGPRLFMTLGPFIAAGGFLLMLRLQPHVHYLADLLPGILLFGVGLSMTVAPLTSAILGDITPQHAGVASAVNNAVARVAGLIAIALIGIVTGPHIDIHGFHRALGVIATLMLAGSIVSAVGIRRSTGPEV